MRIERVSVDRLEDILRLNAIVQDLHAQQEPGFFRATDENAVRDFLRSAFQDGSVTFLLASEGSLPLGYAMVRVQVKPGTAFTFERKYVELEHIAVDPKWTDRGVGGALIDEAVSVAKDLGIPSIELSVWQFNEKAQRLFLSKGFLPHMQRMRRSSGT